MRTRVLEIVRRLHLADGPGAHPDSDPALLNRYLADGNAEAFSLLVRRHGPMVLAVCRRVLGDPHAAEDAFQATFLALAKHAGAVRRPSAVAGWLHGVARRAALRLRASAARREAGSLQNDPPAPNLTDPLADISARELLNALDEELQRLPERHRLAIVHCYLEEQTVDEAANRLATTPGAVRGWLARGRARLAERLTVRGFSLPTALFVLTTEVITEVPLAVAATSAPVSPAIAAVAEAAVSAARGSKVGWAVFACVGFAVGIATAGVLLSTPAPPLLAPTQEEPVAKAPPQGDPPETLPAGAVARLGTIRFKVPEIPRSARYSPDGKKLAVGDQDSVVRVFDAKTGWVVRKLPAFSERGDAAIPLYSPDGVLLAVVTSKGRVGVWDSEKGDVPRWVLPPDDADVRHLAFSPDGKLLAGAEEWGKNRVRLWDARSGKDVRQLPAHPKNVTDLAFSPDGKRLATSCEDGTIRLWNPETGKEVQQFAHPDMQTTAVAWSPNGKTLAWAISGWRADKPVLEVVFWDVAVGKEQARGTWTNGPIRELVFTPNGELVLGDETNNTHGWNPKTGKQVLDLRHLGGIGNEPSLAITPDGKTLATPALSEIVFTDLPTGERRERFPGPQRQASAVAYAPDGKTAAVGAGDGRVYLYDPVTAELRRVLRGDDNAVTGVAFSPDGKTLAVTAGHSEFVRLWNPADGELVGKLSAPDKDGGFAEAVAFSPDGKSLAVTSYGIVRLFDLATGKQDKRLGKKEFSKANTLAFSPDGKVLATGGDDREIRFWNVSTGALTTSWEVRGNVKSLAFAPDGSSLVWCANGGWCQVWEVPTGRVLARMKGHEYGVESVAFTPDGKRVVTAGTFDTGPRVWDAATGKELIGFRGHFKNPSKVAVAPDGQTVASAGEDGQVLVWDLNTKAVGTGPIGPPPVHSEVTLVPKGAGRLGDAGSAGGVVAFSPDGKRLAAAVLVPGSEAGVAIWDLATRKVVWRVENDTDEVTELFWTADGVTVAAVSERGGRAALVMWNADTGKELKRVDGVPGLCSYALSPDGKTLAARDRTVSRASGKPKRSGGEIDLIDVATGKRVRRIEGHDGDSVAWSPDGKLLVGGSSANSPVDTIRVWNPATGEVVREWNCRQKGAKTLFFLSDGTTLAASGEKLKFWDVQTGKLIREANANEGRTALSAVTVSLSADGKRVALHGFDSPVVVQDTGSGRRIGTYEGGRKWYGVALSPDGKSLVTSGGGNLFVWPVPRNRDD